MKLKKGLPKMKIVPKCARCGVSNKKLYRPYGEFRRPENDRCNRCLAFMRPSHRQWYVPLIVDDWGSAWGYSAIPYLDVQRFRATPETCWWGPRWTKRDKWQSPALAPTLVLWASVVIILLLILCKGG